MGEFLEKLYDVLFHPFTAMRQIAAEAKVGQAAIAFLLSVLIPALAIYFGFKSVAITAWGNVILMLQVVGSIFIWWIGAAFLHLVAELFGGQGKAAGLLSCMGFSYLPRIFMVPLWVIGSFMPEGIRSILLALSVIVVSVWTLWLHVVAIKQAHRISTAKSTLVLLSPLLLLFGFIACLCVFLTSAIKLPFSLM